MSLVSGVASESKVCTLRVSARHQGLMIKQDERSLNLKGGINIGIKDEFPTRRRVNPQKRPRFGSRKAS